VNREPTPALISGVRAGSLAAEAGIAPGDALVSLGGRALRDAVDYQFYQAEPLIEALILKADGLHDAVLFEKSIDEDLGIEFKRATWDDVMLCNNNCFFCFLKGLPKGLRKPLYTKDDDYRLSFLHGNFVTLSNLSEADWERLAEQRLSPLNVSVHATEPALRRKLLGNPRAPDICDQLRRLGDLGIRAHTQIVLTPGVNDGANLDRSVCDLVALHPTVQTVSVVPVGASPKLEDWSLARDGIPLERPDPVYSRALIEQLRPVQLRCRREFGATVVQCSDEYYVTAGVPVPRRDAYDGFSQYENGVGMVRTLLDRWARTRTQFRKHPVDFSGRRVAIGCGTLAAPLLQDIASEFSAETGAAVQVVPIENTLFGERVNVSGLLPGADFARALRHCEADIAILPRPSLDYFGERFLDGMTPRELETALGRPVAFASQWSEVLEIVQRGPGSPRRNAAPNGAFWSTASKEASRPRSR
jgi:putative radical SAM enzyme (TIGR03279 family)